MNSEIKDLVDDSGMVTFTDIACQFDFHVNKAKNLIRDFAKANKEYEPVYYMSGVRDGCVTITLARGKEQRRQKSEAFDRIFSHHVYAVAKKDYDFSERKLDKPVPNRLGIRDIPEKDRTVKTEIKAATTHVDPFKKKAPPAKPIAKAFAKTTKKEVAESKTPEVAKNAEKTEKPKNDFFKSQPKKTKKEPKSPVVTKKPEKVEKKVEKMEVDESSEDEIKPRKTSPRAAKIKRRRIQVDSSSEEENTEAQKLLFGDSQEERVRNLSLDDEPKVLAEDTMMQSSEDEQVEEKENVPEKKKKTSFGSAKVIGNGKPTRKVKKKKYTGRVDDEGNMVTETYYEEEEIPEAELEKEKEKSQKEKKPAEKKPAPKKAAPAPKPGNMKQKSISAFFKKK